MRELRLTGLRVHNFKSYIGPKGHSAPFRRTRPGDISLIFGVNEENPRLGANGVGKSTLLDAVAWCLYGKTLRGLRTPQILPQADPDKHVDVQVRIGREDLAGRDTVIRRTANPNSLAVQREQGAPFEACATEDVERLVGMDWELFVGSVCHGQFTSWFLDRTSAGKVRYLSKVLRLDCWEHATRAARDSARKLSEEADGIAADHAAAAARAEELRAVLATAEKTPRRKAPSLKKLLAAADSAASEAAEARRVEQQAASALGRRQRSYNRHDRQHVEVRTRIEAKRAETHAARKALAVAKARKAGECDTCGQALTPAALRASVATARKAWRAARAELLELQQLYDRVTARRAAARVALDSAAVEFAKAEDHAGRADSDESKASAILKAEKRSPSRRAARSQASASRKSQERLKTLEANTERLKKRLKIAHSRIRVAERWAARFAELRLWEIRRVLVELSAAANSHLVDLGMPRWRVHLGIQRSKSDPDKITGLEVSVSKGSADMKLRWEAWSGGETQRIRVAVQAALADIIRARRPATLATEFWDEPTMHLSREGTGELVEFLHARARRNRLAVWIVDHRAIHYGQFKERATVVRRRLTKAKSAPYTSAVGRAVTTDRRVAAALDHRFAQTTRPRPDEQQEEARTEEGSNA